MLHKAWNSKGEMPYCFQGSSIKFQGHTGQNITDFDPNWAFPDYRPVAAFKSLRFALFFLVKWKIWRISCIMLTDLIESYLLCQHFRSWISFTFYSQIPLSRAPLTHGNQLVAVAPWTPNFSDSSLAAAHMTEPVTHMCWSEQISPLVHSSQATWQPFNLSHCIEMPNTHLLGHIG